MEKRKQHYIPQFYLKYFTDPMTPAIYEPYVWVLNKETGEIKQRAPKNIAYENGFNDIVDSNGNISSIVEEEFQQIENEAAKAFRKVMKFDELSEYEKISLSKFIISMRFRTPSFISTYKSIIQRKDVKELFYKEGLDFIPNEIEMDSTIRVTNLVEKWLLRMEWSLLISPKEKKFITSDNPVLVKNIQDSRYIIVGFGLKDDVEIIFPISPNFCLYGSWKSNRMIIENIGIEETKEINIEVFKNSFDYVYSSSKEIDKEILILNSMINRGAFD